MITRAKLLSVAQVSAYLAKAAAVVQFIKDVRIAYRSEKPFSSGIETFTFHDIPMLHKDHWHHRIVTPLPTTSRSA